jgi:hypothetical protein
MVLKNPWLCQRARTDSRCLGVFAKEVKKRAGQIADRLTEYDDAKDSRRGFGFWKTARVFRLR